MLVPNPPQDFDAVQVWHRDIEEDSVRPALFENLEPLLPTGRDKDLVTFLRERVSEDAGDDWLIIDDKNSHARTLYTNYSESLQASQVE